MRSIIVYIFQRLVANYRRKGGNITTALHLRHLWQFILILVKFTLRIIVREYRQELGCCNKYWYIILFLNNYWYFEMFNILRYFPLHCHLTLFSFQSYVSKLKAHISIYFTIQSNSFFKQTIMTVNSKFMINRNWPTTVWYMLLYIMVASSIL